MRKIYADEEFKNKYMATVVEADHYNGQLTTFVNWLYDNGFYRNYPDEDVEEGFEWGITLRTQKITIGITAFDKCIIGIDPTYCWDKLGKSSILVELPLSKRKEKAFYDTLNRLVNDKHFFNKWAYEACRCWCGKYLHFESKKS